MRSEKLLLLRGQDNKLFLIRSQIHIRLRVCVAASVSVCMPVAVSVYVCVFVSVFVCLQERIR